MWTIRKLDSSHNITILAAHDANADFDTGNCYFWTSIETAMECLFEKQNNEKHRFVFEYASDALKIAHQELDEVHLANATTDRDYIYLTDGIVKFPVYKN